MFNATAVFCCIAEIPCVLLHIMKSSGGKLLAYDTYLK